MNESQRIRSYTPQQIADLLGYKVSSIYALLSRKELLASTVGRSRMISQEQLNDFLHHRKGSDVVIDYTK
jgi:excisionase family DNA binding protein